MPAFCSVKGCKNKGGHFFPKDPELFGKWMVAMAPGFRPSKHSRICSDHFWESDYATEGYYSGVPLTKKILKKDAVPSVFPWNADTTSKAETDWSLFPPKDPEKVLTPLRADRLGKRKSEEPITKLCVISNKAVLLIQDPDYGGSSDNDASAPTVTTDSEEDAPEEEEISDKSLREISVRLSEDPRIDQNNELLKAEASLFEYDVASRPSLRQVSTKSQSDDALQDRVYTSEQRDVVIDKLNAVRSDENVRNLLGPKLTKSIESYLHSNGSFSKLEELLKVQSVGPKTVRALCDKLLGITPEKKPRSRSTSPTASPLSPGRRSRSLSHLVTPPLSEEFCMSVNLLSAIIVDVTSVSWVLVDTKKKTLIDWKTLSVDVPLSSLWDVVSKATEIEKQLPPADLFVLEDPVYGSRGGHHFKSHLTCALATAIHNQRGGASGAIKMAFTKNRLVEKHFDATVGSETISLQPFLQEVVDQKAAVGRSNLFISQDHLAYYKALDSVAREQLSRAGLLSLSCVDLVLNKREPLDRRKQPRSSEVE